MSKIHNQHSLSKPVVQNNNLPRNYHLVPEQFKEVAEGMEKQFARFMIEEMNKTVSHSDQSSAANLYRSGSRMSRLARSLVMTVELESRM